MVGDVVKASLGLGVVQRSQEVGLEWFGRNC